MTYTYSEMIAIMRRLKTDKQRVLFRLWRAKYENEVFWLDGMTRKEAISGGWLPMWALRGSMLGGDSADRRLRQLRDENGIQFKETIVNGHIRPYKVHQWVSTPGNTSYIYCLALDPHKLDWNELLEQWPKWVWADATREQVALAF